MLDTNAASDIIKRPDGKVASKAIELGPDRIGLSAVVAAELLFGVEKRGSPRLALLIDGVVSRFPVVDFSLEASRTYGKVRDKLRRAGNPIGPLDTLIAAHAISLEATLLTNNTAEFRRVEGLKIEDWTQP